MVGGNVVGGGDNSTITHSPASGESLKPVQAQGIDLGAVSGVAYYTVERDGFRVVVTLAQPGQDAAVPVRLEAVLTPGQSVLLSAPRGADSPPDAVEISRHADTVLVRQEAPSRSRPSCRDHGHGGGLAEGVDQSPVAGR